jgi:hypothetical protein
VTLHLLTASPDQGNAATPTTTDQATATYPIGRDAQFVHGRNHWPAVERYKRTNTAAVTRARGFGFTAEGCGYEWVVY